MLPTSVWEAEYAAHSQKAIVEGQKAQALAKAARAEALSSLAAAKGAKCGALEARARWEAEVTECEEGVKGKRCCGCVLSGSGSGSEKAVLPAPLTHRSLGGDPRGCGDEQQQPLQDSDGGDEGEGEEKTVHYNSVGVNTVKLTFDQFDTSPPNLDSTNSPSPYTGTPTGPGSNRTSLDHTPNKLQIRNSLEDCGDMSPLGSSNENNSSSSTLIPSSSDISTPDGCPFVQQPKLVDKDKQMDYEGIARAELARVQAEAAAEQVAAEAVKAEAAMTWEEVTTAQRSLEEAKRKHRADRSDKASQDGNSCTIL